MIGGAVRRALGRRARRAVARLLPTAAVLAYHRVASPPSDPQLLCVAPERFAQQLRALRSVGECVSLRDLVRAHAANRLPRRAIAITFDDGYADNLTVAEPLLRTAAVPATVFVSTGGLAEGHPFWWDEVESLMLHGTINRPEIALTARGRRFRWSVGANPDELTDGAGDAVSWDVTRGTPPTARHAAYWEIVRLCRALSLEERGTLLEDLKGQVESWPLGDHRRLTPDEVARLAASSVIEVGSHAVSHTVPGGLTPGVFPEELRSSKEYLEQVTERAVDLLAYPFGARGDLTAASIRSARQCGYAAACANYAGLVWRWSDLYSLPRFLVRDWDGEALGQKLEDWFDGRA